MCSVCCAPGSSGPFLQNCFGPSAYWTQCLLVHGVIPPLVRDLVFPFPELHKVPVGPLFHAVEVPLNSSTIIWSSRSSSQFCIICKLAEGELCPITLITREVCQCGAAVTCTASLLDFSPTLFWSKPAGSVSVLIIAFQLSLALEWSHMAWNTLAVSLSHSLPATCWKVTHLSLPALLAAPELPQSQSWYCTKNIPL